MYNEQIEKLIQMSLTDGELSEKEKITIIKKAKDYGISEGEIEILINAISHSKNTKNVKEKNGNIKTCPSCGAPVKPLELNCEICSHEFTNIEANKNLQEIVKKLEKEDNNTSLSDSERKNRKAIIINQYSIPHSKEALIEFLSFAVSSIEFLNSDYLDNNPEKTAWASKSNQIIFKLKLSNLNNLDKAIVDELESKIKVVYKNKKNMKTSLFVGLGVFFFGGSFAVWYFWSYLMYKIFGLHFWPF